MSDLLTIDHNGRLTVVEVETEENLQFLMQALDYWIRVRELNNFRQQEPEISRAISAFELQGYFPKETVSPLPPRLVLVVPALRIHPRNDELLRCLSSEIDWELITINERWRHGMVVVSRKRSEKKAEEDTNRCSG